VKALPPPSKEDRVSLALRLLNSPPQSEDDAEDADDAEDQEPAAAAPAMHRALARVILPPRTARSGPETPPGRERERAGAPPPRTPPPSRPEPSPPDDSDVGVIKIADDFFLPKQMVTESIGIVAARGSGKTYTTAVMAEELFIADLPFLVIDPLGVYWGIRSSADGTDVGLPVIVLGGDHGDLPLEAGSGRAVARWVLEYRKPTVLDLSNFRKAEQRLFVSDLAEELYTSCKAPLHMIVDESDLFIPQKPGPDDKRVLAAFEDIVRRGRVRGLGITVVTQRPAVIHKDILTQIGTLVVMRMMGPQDRKAIEDWIKFHGDPAKQRMVLASLASLPIGTAWIWSPGWLGLLRKVAVRERLTFDSSITPKTGGQPRKLPLVMAEVDVEELRATLAAATDHDPNDPRVLKARIAELEKALVEGGSGTAGGLLSRLQKRVTELEHELLAQRSRGGGGGAVAVNPEVLSRLVERVTWLCETFEKGSEEEEGSGDEEEGSGDEDQAGEEPEPEPEPEEPVRAPPRAASAKDRTKGKRR